MGSPHRKWIIHSVPFTRVREVLFLGCNFKLNFNMVYSAAPKGWLFDSCEQSCALHVGAKPAAMMRGRIKYVRVGDHVRACVSNIAAASFVAQSPQPCYRLFGVSDRPYKLAEMKATSCPFAQTYATDFLRPNTR
jgi:hypothetical protein